MAILCFLLQTFLRLLCNMGIGRGCVTLWTRFKISHLNFKWNQFNWLLRMIKYLPSIMIVTHWNKKISPRIVLQDSGPISTVKSLAGSKHHPKSVTPILCAPIFLTCSIGLDFVMICMGWIWLNKGRIISRLSARKIIMVVFCMLIQMRIPGSASAYSHIPCPSHSGTWIKWAGPNLLRRG